MPEGKFVKDDAKAEIEQLQQKHDEGRWWTRQFLYASIVIVIAAAFLPISTEQFIVAALFGYSLFLLHFALDIRDRGRRRKITKKVHAYNREKALPTYHDVLQAMGGKYHIHLEDDGSISIRSFENVQQSAEDKQKDNPEDREN